MQWESQIEREEWDADKRQIEQTRSDHKRKQREEGFLEAPRVILFSSSSYRCLLSLSLLSLSSHMTEQSSPPQKKPLHCSDWTSDFADTSCNLLTAMGLATKTVKNSDSDECFPQFSKNNLETVFQNPHLVGGNTKRVRIGLTVCCGKICFESGICEGVVCMCLWMGVVCCVCGSKGHVEDFVYAMIYAMLGCRHFWALY